MIYIRIASATGVPEGPRAERKFHLLGEVDVHVDHIHQRALAGKTLVLKGYASVGMDVVFLSL